MLYSLNHSKEKFLSELDDLQSQINAFGDKGDIKVCRQINEEIEIVSKSLSNAENTAAELNEEEARLGWSPTPYTQVKELQKQVEPYAKLWENAAQYIMKIQSWNKGPVFKLDAEEVKKEAENLTRNAVKSFKYFNGKSAEPAKVAGNIKDNLNEFNKNIPLLAAICNKGMRDRHWKEIKDTIGVTVTPDDHTSLHRLLERGVDHHLETLGSIFYILLITQLLL